MIRRAPFSIPMRALRRAAWTIAAQGKLSEWNDPMPHPSQIPAARLVDERLPAGIQVTAVTS